MTRMEIPFHHPSQRSNFRIVLLLDTYRFLKQIIDPLPPIDHSEFKYDSFEKNFYIEHEEISSMSRNASIDLRSTLGLKVTGPSPPKPVTSFGHFNLDEGLLKTIRKSEYTQPTPIQSQAVPTALGGRDIIGDFNCFKYFFIV
jgi:ATP-dependent RNA helicase DDX42